MNSAIELSSSYLPQEDLIEPSIHPEILFTVSLPYTFSDMDLSALLVHFLSIDPNIGIHTCHTYVQTVIC